MRKATSAGLDQAGVPVAVLRSPSGLGRRTPKKNARKRIILQEKISRELSASRNRVSDGQVRCPGFILVPPACFLCQLCILIACDLQVNVHRCVSLAASLQVCTLAKKRACCGLLFSGRFCSVSYCTQLVPCMWQLLACIFSCSVSVAAVVMVMMMLHSSLVVPSLRQIAIVRAQGPTISQLLPHIHP